MHQNEFDPLELRRSMRFALDLVAAHRIAKGFPSQLCAGFGDLGEQSFVFGQQVVHITGASVWVVRVLEVEVGCGGNESDVRGLTGAGCLWRVPRCRLRLPLNVGYQRHSARATDFRSFLVGRACVLRPLGT